MIFTYTLHTSILVASNDVFLLFHFFSGGLRAVIFTDTLQTFILVAGAVVVTIVCM